MRIGIDISQISYEQTGVSNYLRNLVDYLFKNDRENEYVLFFSSLRRSFDWQIFRYLKNAKSVQFGIFKFPPIFLDFLWNKLHIVPIEWLIGDIDIFITSDWTEPPTTSAKKVTILYDLSVFKYPEETDKKIVQVQQSKIKWVNKECNIIICISESTKSDAMEILGIEEKRLKVVYPGI